MGDSGLTRRELLEAAVLGSVASALVPAGGGGAAEASPGVPLYAGEPSIGEPGYDERVARLFGQAKPGPVRGAAGMV